MTIVHYEPWRLFNRVFSEGVAAPAAGNSSSVTWLPVVDVLEEADRFVVRADLPGVDPKDVEITAEKGVLTVRGQRLYSLISLPADEMDTITIQIPPGVSAYDFTFG